MKTIGIFTTTRADFGNFIPLINKLNVQDEFDYKLFVGGSHLKPQDGYTINEIIDNGFTICGYFDYLLNTQDSFGLSKSAGIAVYELARIFHEHKFNYCFIIGDRFELLAIAMNCILFKVPILHIGGGERTEGVIDEQVRHAITKISHIHFTSCEEYRQNVLNMGESPDKVFNVGDLSVDNMKNLPVIEKEVLFSDLKLNIKKPLVLLTYHPVTLEFSIPAKIQVENIFKALSYFNFQVIVTAPNTEDGQGTIINVIQEQILKNQNYRFISSLGTVRYLNLIRYCEFVIGNSSSGLTEVPYFRGPTINIGDRQKGRIRHKSIIDSSYDERSIVEGIEKAISDTFKKSLLNMSYKFGDGSTASRIVEILKNIDERNILIKSLHY